MHLDILPADGLIEAVVIDDFLAKPGGLAIESKHADSTSESQLAFIQSITAPFTAGLSKAQLLLIIMLNPSSLVKVQVYLIPRYICTFPISEILHQGTRHEVVSLGHKLVLSNRSRLSFLVRPATAMLRVRDDVPTSYQQQRPVYSPFNRGKEPAYEVPGLSDPHLICLVEVALSEQKYTRRASVPKDHPFMQGQTWL